MEPVHFIILTFVLVDVFDWIADLRRRVRWPGWPR